MCLHRRTFLHFFTKVLLLQEQLVSECTALEMAAKRVPNISGRLTGGDEIQLRGTDGHYDRREGLLGVVTKCSLGGVCGPFR